MNAQSGQQKPTGNSSILVTGASGFIGSKLVMHFTASGTRVRAMSRKNLQDAPNVENVQADAFDLEQLSHALKGVKVAYYLLHSMEGDKEWGDFTKREQTQAENFASAAKSARVERIIYLGGLVNDSLGLSPHMQSRKKVGEILAASGIPVTELRASLIVGAGGSSYAVLHYLADRLPIMVCPKWVGSLAQPIAADDVIYYMAKCLDHPETIGKILEIGGPDVMSYRKLLHTCGSRLGKKIKIIKIPFLTTRLSSYWIDLVTPVGASIARPLIDSLVHDTIVSDDKITRIIPIKLCPVGDAIDKAASELSQKSKDTSKTIQNKRSVITLLLFMAAIGTSYYWLDNRPEVYQISWLFASLVWFIVIANTVFFVYQETRLGYLIAGMLSWATLGFWLLDNIHVAFQASLVAVEPGLEMTARNFVGAIATVMCIVVSHNAFHRIRRSKDKS